MDMTSNWTTVKRMKMEQKTTTKSKEERLRERTKPPMGPTEKPRAVWNGDVRTQGHGVRIGLVSLVKLT
jgi:hypothetical protein